MQHHTMCIVVAISAMAGESGPPAGIRMRNERVSDAFVAMGGIVTGYSKLNIRSS